MNTSSASVSDDEIVADLLRLARSGRFRRTAPLLREAGAIYPAQPPERIKACLVRLGTLLN